MRKQLLMIICLFIKVIILTSCSTAGDNDSIEKEGIFELMNDTSSEDHSIYQQTIKDFKTAVESNDPQALYDLIDLNYEGEVYWTVVEAQELIDFFMENQYLFDIQVLSLEESIDRIETFMEAGRYDTEETRKRIPFAPSDNGLIFLQPNGKLSVKIFKHTLIASENSLGDFDEVILKYQDTEKEFRFNHTYFKNNKYKNHNNEEVIDIMHVGPGNYTIESVGIYGDNQAEYEETIKLTDFDMSVDLKKKSVKIIHLFFKKHN